MNLDKDKVRKIIDLIFYNLKGNKFIENKDEFKDSDFNKIIDDYLNLKNYDNLNFWKKILEKIKLTYEINEEIKNKLKENFGGFISSLLLKRILKENFGKFEENLEEESTFIKKLKEKIPEKNLIYVENEKKNYFLILEEKTTKGRIKDITENYKLHEYICGYHEDKKISLIGRKQKINNFKTIMNKTDENYPNILIKPENLKEINNFFTNLKRLIKDLKYKNIFLNGIEYKGNNITNFFLKSENILDIENEIFFDFIFNDLNEFLNIKKLCFTYFYEEEKGFKFELEIRKSKDGENRLYFKIEFYPKSRIKEREKISKSIKEILNKLNLNIDNSFYYPEDFILSKLIYDKNKIYYSNLKNISINSLEFLKNKEILSELNDEISINKEKLIKIIEEKFKKYLNKTQNLKNENKIEIKNIKKENSKIILDLKIENNNIINFENLILNFQGRLRKYDKIQNIILNEINFKKILFDGEKEIFEYLSLEIQKYKIYNQNILLEKKAISSYNFLKEKLENLSEKDKNKDLGNQVEENLNIILKFLFRNFIPIGGKNNPDGKIILNKNENENESFVIDSKMNKTINNNQYNHMKTYIKNESESNTNTNVKVKGGIFFISLNWTKNSLNKDEIMKDENKDMFFISLELILYYFEIFQKNKSLILSNYEIFKKVSNKIFEKNKSKVIDTIENLKKFEEKKKSYIEKTFNNSNYVNNKK